MCGRQWCTGLLTDVVMCTGRDGLRVRCGELESTVELLHEQRGYVTPS